MSFPISSQGAIRVSVADASDIGHLVRAVEAVLKKRRADSIVCSADLITFKGGILVATWTWNVISAISHGEIRFSCEGDTVEIVYRISLIQMLIINSCFLCIAAVVIANAVTSFHQFLLVFTLASGWIIGGNYVIAIFRFPSLIIDAVEGSGKALSWAWK